MQKHPFESSNHSTLTLHANYSPLQPSQPHPQMTKSLLPIVSSLRCYVASKAAKAPLTPAKRQFLCAQFTQTRINQGQTKGYFSTGTTPNECSINDSAKAQEAITTNEWKAEELTSKRSPAFSSLELNVDAEAEAESEEALNPYFQLPTDEVLRLYQASNSLSLAEYNEFLFALRFKREPEHALRILEDMKIKGCTPNAESYAHAFLAGCYFFFPNELEDLVNSRVSLFSPTDRNYTIKRKLAQMFLEAVGEAKITFRGELYAPMIMRLAGRENRKEFASTAFVFAKLCATSGFPISNSVYSHTMSLLNKHDLDAQVVALFEALPSSASAKDFFLQMHYLRALIKLDRGTQAFNLLNSFLETIEQKLAIFNVLINAALKSKNLTLARALYHKMPSYAIQPNEATVSLFVEHAGKPQDENVSGLALLEEFNIEAAKNQIVKGPRFYSALFKSLSKLDLGKVNQVLGEAVAAKAVDRRLLECIIGLFADNRVPSYVKLELYALIEPVVAGKEPKDSFVASMYSLVDSRIIEIFAAIEEFTLQEFQNASVRGSSRSSGGTGPGLPMQNSEPAFRALMRAFWARKQHDAAIGLASHIMQNHLQFTSPPGYIMNTAVEVALAKGDSEMAQELVRNMKYRGVIVKDFLREKYQALIQKMGGQREGQIKA